MNEPSTTKKALILETARRIGVQKWTPAEIDQLRRRLIAEHGEAGKTGAEYIADVLEGAGWKLELTLQEEAEDQYEEEFEDLLHFKTLEDAEVSVMRLDELMRKFRSQGETAAVERVLNVARLGQAASGNDFAQSQSGSAEARGERRDRQLVSHLAGDSGRVFRLAGRAQAVCGIPKQISARGAGRMSAPGNALGSGALDLPPFSLDVESLSLGSEVKAVGMELLETESREPVRGSQAAQIWSAAFPVLAGEEFYALDFFSHLDRVREFCDTHEIRVSTWRRSGAWWYQSPRRSNCWNYSAGLRAKLLVCALGLRPRRRYGAGRRIIQTRAGRLPERLCALHVLRRLRAGRWLDNAAHRKIVAQRSDPPRAAGAAAVRRAHRAA